MLLSSYCGIRFVVFLLQRLVCHRFIVVFGLSSACYDVVFLFVLLQHFICVRAIQTSKENSINQEYQIMIVNILKN